MFTRPRWCLGIRSLAILICLALHVCSSPAHANDSVVINSTAGSFLSRFEADYYKQLPATEQAELNEALLCDLPSQRLGNNGLPGGSLGFSFVEVHSIADGRRGIHFCSTLGAADPYHDIRLHVVIYGAKSGTVFFDMALDCQRYTKTESLVNLPEVDEDLIAVAFGYASNGDAMRNPLFRVERIAA